MSSIRFLVVIAALSLLACAHSAAPVGAPTTAAFDPDDAHLVPSTAALRVAP